MVISIPDYNNYVVTGVTTALAWGLPYKPTYAEAELQDQYEQGHLPILNRRHYDTNTTNNNDNNYVDNSASTESITPNMSAMVDGGGGHGGAAMEMNTTRQQQQHHLLNSFRQLYEMYSNRRRHDNFENVIDGRPNVYYNLNAYEAFGRYLIETYFRPWQEVDAMATAATTIATATTVKKQPYVRFCRLNVSWPVSDLIIVCSLFLERTSRRQNRRRPAMISHQKLINCTQFIRHWANEAFATNWIVTRTNSMSIIIAAHALNYLASLKLT